MNLIFQKISDDFQKFESCESFKLYNKKLCSDYYREYYGPSFQDLSFLVLHNNSIVGYVSCCVINDKLSRSGDGINIQVFNIENSLKGKVYHEIIKHIGVLAQKNNCRFVEIKDYLSSPEALSDLGHNLLNNGYQSKISFDMRVSFTSFSEENYHTTIRKSYRSLINWGKKALKTVYVNKMNQDTDLFQRFKCFHHKICGRVTRSEKTWAVQYEMLCEGFGELSLGFLNNELVAGSLFVDQEDVSMYFTGVYERELFQYGISHFLLYDGIFRSHNRGNSSNFSLGCFENNLSDQKLYNIQFFKKGFCKQLSPTIIWENAV